MYFYSYINVSYMQISVYCHLRVDPNNNVKQASINVADLGIITSSFFDLENATSAVSS